MSENVVINEGVVITKSLICPGVVIGKGSKVMNCIIQKGAVIGEK